MTTSITSAAFIDLRINNAEQLKESVSEPSPNTVLYLTYGKTDAWANDAAPTAANSSVALRYEIWNNMIGGKRILGGNMMHAIDRHNWTSGTTYTAYDHMSDDLYNENTVFYVVNSDYSVYKCLANNTGQPSTVEPTSVNPSISSSTSDGYVWKYMYSISDSEQIRFTTDDYIPVKTLTEDEGSLQWQVQTNAVDGAINAIYITNAGNNYTTDNVVVTITGDGSSATASATLNTETNTISSIYMTDVGSGYTFADVTITGGSGTSAAARAIISPIGGHGSDPIYELGGKNIMINMTLNYSENSVLVDDNDFRQISIIKDPYDFNKSNVSRQLAVNQTEVLTMSGVDDYIQDELVYQGTSYSTGTFKARVASWDSANNLLYVINTLGDVTASQSLIGTESFTARIVSSVTNPHFEKYSGKILYADHLVPITRSNDQIEDFKILVKF